MEIKSIQNKLMLIFLPLFICSFLALGGISYYFSKQIVEKSVSETANALGQDYANRIAADMREIQIHLEDLASIQRVRAGADRQQITEAIAEAQKRINKLDNTIFIFPDGNAIRSDGTTGQLGDRDYFKKVVATQKAAISDPLVSRSTGKLSVNVAVPVLYNGKVSGVLTGPFSLDKLAEKIKGIKFKDTGYGYIIDDSGTVMTHPQLPATVGKLSFKEKKVNPELKLAVTELDDRIMKLFALAADKGEQVQGRYEFGAGEQFAVMTPIELPGGQRWIMAVTAPVSEMQKEINAMTISLALASTVCLVIVGLLILLIARRFARPIVQINEEATLLTQGDLRDRGIQVQSADEVGQLAKGFRTMADNLRGLVRNVQKQAEQVAAASQELTANADQSAKVSESVAGTATEMAAGATKQVNAVNDTAAVVEQISASIQEVAATANNLAAMAEQTSVRSGKGRQNVEKAVAQINSVGQGTQEMVQTVRALQDSSKQIYEIVGMISGIAGQTNLLALNAAIEAARAGEQGRGFAVVAEEVRKLAEQSEDAAKQIAELIQKNNEQIDATVTRMDRAKSDVESGVVLVNSAGSDFKDIAGMVADLSSQIRDISAAVQEMAAGSQKIIHSVGDVQKVSQKTATDTESISAAMEEQSAAMEEISSSSQELARLAGELSEAVNRFRV